MEMGLRKRAQMREVKMGLRKKSNLLLKLTLVLANVNFCYFSPSLCQSTWIYDTIEQTFPPRKNNILIYSRDFHLTVIFGKWIICKSREGGDAGETDWAIKLASTCSWTAIITFRRQHYNFALFAILVDCVFVASSIWSFILEFCNDLIKNIHDNLTINYWLV